MSLKELECKVDKVKHMNLEFMKPWMKNKPDVPALRVCVRLIADQARETNVGYFSIAVVIAVLKLLF